MLPPIDYSDGKTDAGKNAVYKYLHLRYKFLTYYDMHVNNYGIVNKLSILNII